MDSQPSTGIGIHNRVSDQVYAQLHTEIVSGDRVPGERVDLNEVATRLGVSRTPVREAILRLEAGGLVQRQPYRGVVVSGVDLTVASDVAAVRLHLESLATRMAVPRIQAADLARMRATHEQLALKLADDVTQDAFRRLNREFHLTLYRAAGSSVLLRQIEDLQGQAERIRLHFDVRKGSAMHSHAQILAACEAGDTEAAVAATRRHILDSYLAMVPDDSAEPEGSLLSLVAGAEVRAAGKG